MTSPLAPSSVRVRPTGPGWCLLAVTTVALVLTWSGAGITAGAVAAIFYGALTIVSAVASWRRASSVRISAPPPVTTFAGERFVLDVPVANLARRGDAFDLLLTCLSARPDGGRVGAFVARIPAGAETRVAVAHPALRRGRFGQGTLEIASAFPLGLWTCRLRFSLPNEILVLPRLGTLRRVPRSGAQMRGNSGHGGAGRGDEQEVYGVRDWRDGEGLRAVHWKLSARRGRLLVREFRSEPRPPVHVILSTAVPEDARGAKNRFEDAVSLAATLVESEVRSGRPVRLTLHGRATRTIRCLRGRTAIFPALRALAEVSADEGATPPDVASMTARARPDERILVVRVGAGNGSPRGAAAVGPVTVFDVTADGISSVFDRRRRPSRELLLGVRR
jgi:uncharacterized protein (DUF58 family)